LKINRKKPQEKRKKKVKDSLEEQFSAQKSDQPLNILTESKSPKIRNKKLKNEFRMKKNPKVAFLN